MIEVTPELHRIQSRFAFFLGDLCDPAAGRADDENRREIRPRLTRESSGAWRIF
jgi:hypothetical protein